MINEPFYLSCGFSYPQKKKKKKKEKKRKAYDSVPVPNL